MATPDRKKATKGLKFLGRALSELDPYDFAINLTLGNGTETQLEIENASDMVLGPRDRVHKDTDWTEWLPSALDIDLVAGQRKNEYYSMHKDGVKKVTVTFISTSEGDRTVYIPSGSRSINIKDSPLAILSGALARLHFSLLSTVLVLPVGRFRRIELNVRPFNGPLQPTVSISRVEPLPGFTWLPKDVLQLARDGGTIEVLTDHRLGQKKVTIRATAAAGDELDLSDATSDIVSKRKKNQKRANSKEAVKTKRESKGRGLVNVHSPGSAQSNLPTPDFIKIPSQPFPSSPSTLEDTPQPGDQDQSPPVSGSSRAKKTAASAASKLSPAVSSIIKTAIGRKRREPPLVIAPQRDLVQNALELPLSTGTRLSDAQRLSLCHLAPMQRHTRASQVFKPNGQFYKAYEHLSRKHVSDDLLVQAHLERHEVPLFRKYSKRASHPRSSASVSVQSETNDEGNADSDGDGDGEYEEEPKVEKADDAAIDEDNMGPVYITAKRRRLAKRKSTSGEKL